MISFKVLLGVLFGLLVATIAVLTVVSFQNNRASLDTADLVRRTHEVLDQADEISSLFKDIQVESNTFFISRDSSLISPYMTAIEQIYPRINELKSLTIDNPEQQQRIDSLKVSVDRLIAFTSAGLSSDQERSMADVNTRLSRNAAYRQYFREIIHAIKQDEERLLLQREEAYRSNVSAFNATSLSLMGVIGILLTTTFFTIRYNFNKRIKAQSDLEKANDRFVKLFDESPIAVVISNLATGVILDCNKEFAHLLRFDKSEVIGKTAVQLGILPGDQERNQIVQAAQDGNIVHDLEVTLRPKDSDPIVTAISIQGIQINDQKCLLCAIQDMTVYKQAEEKIRHALETEMELNRMKSSFITLASHEFRTPLTTVLSSASLIEKYSVGEQKEKIGKHVSRIKKAVNLLTSILNEFLSLSKIQEGKVEPKAEIFNLRETVETLCLDLKNLAKPGQRIIYKHSGEELIFSDHILLENIVNNLISNAIKYSHENSEIYVSSEVNSSIHLSVKDNGIGISREDQQHLFERFFRASNAGNVPGTGLGLHLMKHYVEMLNGAIEVQSEPEKGSEFNVTFREFKSPVG